MVLLGGMGGSSGTPKKKKKQQGVGGSTGLNPFAGGRPDPIPTSSKPNLVSNLRNQQQIRKPLFDPAGQAAPENNLAEFFKQIRTTNKGNLLPQYDNKFLTSLREEQAQVEDPKAPRATPEEIQNLILNPLNPALQGRFQPNIDPAIKKRRPELWNDQQVIQSLTDMATPGTSFFQSQVNQKLNDRLKMQQDALIQRNFDRSSEITDVLKAAKQAAFDGNYNYLSDYMEKHPDFTLDVPKYKAEVGITPKMIEQQWSQIEPHLSPEDKQYWAPQRKDRLINYYGDIRESYFQSRRAVRQALSSYEDSYNESLSFGKKAVGEGADERKKAANLAGPAIPTKEKGGVSAEDQDAFDKIGSKLNGDLKTNDKLREDIKHDLGINKLPSLHELLRMKVRQGVLDANNTDEVAKWTERLSNPNHPDTRALYAVYASSKNPDVDLKSDDVLKFINAPVGQYNSLLEKEAKDKAKKAYDADIKDMEVTTGVGDFFDDMWSKATQKKFSINPGGVSANGITPPSVDAENLEFGESEMHNPLLWTFDKLSRPLYGVAGTFDAVYSLDKDNKAWYDEKDDNPFQAFAKGLLNAATGPGVSTLTGKSPLESVDEIVKDPGNALKKTSNAAYQQLFRGSNLKGINPDTTPMTFSQVIANANDDDGVYNIYDNNKYQLTAGFGLDLALDPLNFVGVGVVDDVLKLPSKVTKGLADSAVGARSLDVYKALTSRDAGAAGKAKLANDLINGLDTVNGARTVDTHSMYTFYRDSRDLGSNVKQNNLGVDYPEFTYVKHTPASQLIEDIKTQRQLAIDTAGVDALTDETIRIGQELGLGNIMPDFDLRVTPIMAETSRSITDSAAGKINGQPYAIHGPGGGLAQDLKALDEVAHAMGFTREASDTAKLGKELDQGLRGDVGKWLEAGAPTDIASLSPVTRRGSNQMEANTIKNRIATAERFKAKYYDLFAQQAGGKGNVAATKAFKEIYAPEDVMRALVHGPKMYMDDSPLAAATMHDAMERQSYAAQNIADAKANTRLTADRRALIIRTNLQARRIAMQQASKVTIDGALQYLDALATLKADGALWRVPEQAEKLKGKRQRLQNLVDLSESKIGKDTPVGDNTSGDFVGMGDAILPKNKYHYDEMDLATQDFINLDMEHFDSSEQALRALGSAAKKQLKAIDKEIAGLRLDADGVITGLPPRQAKRLNDLLPVGSTFKKADGTLDTEKVSSLFHIGDFNDPNGKHAIGFDMPENLTEGEVVFLSLVRDTIETEYLDAYQLIQNRKQGLVPEAPVDTPAPKVEPKEKLDLGPRPTRAALTEEYYKTNKRPRTITEEPIKDAWGPSKRPDAGSLRYKYFDEHSDEIEAWAKRQVDIWQKKADKFQRIIDTSDVNITEASRRAAARDLNRLGKKPTVAGMKMKYAQNEANKMKIDAYVKKNLAEFDARDAKRYEKPKSVTPKDEGLEAYVKAKQKDWDLKNSSRVIGEVKGKAKKRNTGHILDTFRDRPTSKTVAQQFPTDRRRIYEQQYGKDLGGSGNAHVYKDESIDFDADFNGLDSPPEWDQFVKRMQRAWDRAKANAPVGTNKRVKNLDYLEVRDEAFDLARKATIDSIAKADAIKALPGNKIANISEAFKGSLAKAKLELKKQEIDLKLERIAADAAGDTGNVERLTMQIKGLEKKSQKLHTEYKKAGEKARLTSRIMVARYGEEAALQLIGAPAQQTGKMLQLRFLGMKKNLQFTNSLFKSVEAVDAIIPSAVTSNFANTFVRPTKQLDSVEAIRIRAQITGVTPTIIKAHLAQLDHRMGGIKVGERRNMMQAYRDGIDYDGPNKALYGGVKKELDDITDIWNGTNEFYKTRSPFADVKNTSAITWQEIINYLPDEYRPNMKVLKKFYGMGPEKGKVTVDDLIHAIDGNPHPTPKDFTDPARFAHVMRVAMDQAIQLRGIKNTIQRTFGVERRNVDPKSGQVLRHDDKSQLIEKLHSQYGWQTVPWLGKSHYFPPEALQDIAKLEEFTKPSKEMNTVFDKAIGYWKTGVTIYNPGYYTRNGIGEVMASWLDGVTHPKWYRMAKDVHNYTKSVEPEMAKMLEKWASIEGVDIPLDVVSNTKELFRLNGGLKVTVEDVLREYNMLGLKTTFANTDLDSGIREFGKSANATGLRRKGLQVNEAIHDAGEGFEDYLRMAHFMHAMQHSGKTTMRAAAEHAAQKVTKYHFDYTDFSKFEKAVMLRAFPFYKWTRRGAPLMFQHLFLTPGKMTAIPKTLNYMSNMGFDPLGAVTSDPVFSTKDVHEDKNGFLPDYDGWAPQWVKDLFAYQMQPAADDEYAHYFRVQTPQIDGLNILSQIADNPTNPLEWDTALGLLSPLAKIPTELGMNRRLDPDSDYEIYGGDYNERVGLNNGEAIGAYLGQQANPWTAFLGKLSKNGDLGPLSIGSAKEGDEGYQTIRDLASFGSGLGFYQAKDQKPKKDSEELPTNSAPVGYSNLIGMSDLSDRKVASANEDADANINSILSGGGLVGDGSQTTLNGWKNFGYGGSGYRSFGGSGSGFFNLIEYLQGLARQVEQGQVYKGFPEQKDQR